MYHCRLFYLFTLILYIMKRVYCYLLVCVLSGTGLLNSLFANSGVSSNFLEESEAFISDQVSPRSGFNVYVKIMANNKTITMQLIHMKLLHSLSLRFRLRREFHLINRDLFLPESR